MDKASINKRGWKIDRPVKNNYGNLVYVIGNTDSGSVIWSDGSVENSISYYSNLYEYNLLRDTIRKEQDDEYSGFYSKKNP